MLLTITINKPKLVITKIGNYVSTQIGYKQAKFHENILGLSENTAKSFRWLLVLFWLTLCMRVSRFFVPLYILGSS